MPRLKIADNPLSDQDGTLIMMGLMDLRVSFSKTVEFFAETNPEEAQRSRDNYDRVDALIHRITGKAYRPRDWTDKASLEIGSVKRQRAKPQPVP
jgi:hypothetical protein